jgi:hypothetical protein
MRSHVTAWFCISQLLKKIVASPCSIDHFSGTSEMRVSLRYLLQEI